MSTNADNIRLNTDKRLFYISDDIDNTTISVINFNLLYLLQEDDEKEAKEKDFKRTPIKIYINSNGGEIDDMWSLIDIMLNSKTPIYTYCTGYAMSAGFLIELKFLKIRFKHGQRKNKINIFIMKKAFSLVLLMK